MFDFTQKRQILVGNQYCKKTKGNNIDIDHGALHQNMTNILFSTITIP